MYHIIRLYISPPHFVVSKYSITITVGRWNCRSYFCEGKLWEKLRFLWHEWVLHKSIPHIKAF